MDADYAFKLHIDFTTRQKNSCHRERGHFNSPYRFCLKFSPCVIMGIHIVLTAEDVYPGGMHLPPVSAIFKVAGLFSPTYGEHNYFKLIWISADCDSETWRSMERLILMARWWLPNNKETKTSSC